jgi:hypothetical protein
MQLKGSERPRGGATLLHFAVCTASADLVRALLDRGLDSGAKDAAGKTPRDLARALWMVRPREASTMMDLLGRPAEAEKPTAAKPGWEVGATAKHAKFGEGTIKRRCPTRRGHDTVSGSRRAASQRAISTRRS